MAALLTAARILNKMKHSLKGTVKLIFQPSEEYLPSGARAMMEKGDLDDVSAVFGIHVKEDIPTGKVSLEPGPRMAASAGIHIHVKGKGGHGGNPYETVDATVVAASILLNLQTIVSRELNIENSAVISIGTLISGNAKNIISSDAFMEGTCRFYDSKLATILRNSITRIAENTALAYRATAEVDIQPGCPAVINDEKLSECAGKIVKNFWGADAIVKYPKSGLNEDFSYYAEKAPILYVLVGSMNERKIKPYPQHNSRFNIDEDCLKYATELYVKFAFDYLLL